MIVHAPEHSIVRSSLRTALAVACFALVAPSPVHAREPVPIVNYQGLAWTQPVPQAPGELGKRIVATISAHRAEGNFPWVVESAQDGSVLASVRVRAKHTVRVRIAYDRSAYSVVYVDSDNMKAGKDKDGNDVIHPFYNRWTGDLVKAIGGLGGKT